MVMTEPLPYDLQAFEPPPSLWKLVQENVAQEERGEIREILGDSLVEQSLELHTEVELLLEIWRDYREETNGLIPRRRTLPEPPQVRQSLVNHIKILVGSIKEKAKEEGRPSDSIFTDSNSEVLAYVMQEKVRKGTSSPSNMKRPSTATSSRDGRETPLMTPSSDGDMLSLSSTISDQVDSVKEQLNILKIDEVVQQLRLTLEDEIQTLLRDIAFLQDCLEEESDFRAKSVMSVHREPTLSDLKEERAKLQRVGESSLPTTPPGKRSLPTVATRRLPAPLKPSSPKMRPQTVSPQVNGPKQTPLRANHGIVQATNPTLSTTNLSFPGKQTPPVPSPRRINMKANERAVLRPSRPDGSTGVVNPKKMTNSPSPPLQPSPPSSAGLKRPSSAQRFRKMVLDYRQDDS
ncbi:coiled-coil domain-containing protein 24-like [Ptychodera flava]|uniref:coiled-coil domain-containing protein 24-like n=1 Tax=Ptychodera flava TaxID=63121 RepID=UPI00396A8121